MKLWIRKITVALVAIMTLGLYIPPTDLTDAENKDSTISSEATIDKVVVTETSTEQVDPINYENTMATLTKKAKEQTMKKLGPRIGSQLEDEFETVILPKIENELENIFITAKKEEIAYYEITENPARGYGERIFNVYDYHVKKDIAKFHVRRDFRPLEGYWFNFHYHLHDDEFATHYEIGNIYWDKNMPPKWMS